ncbi:ferrochelatase [Vibrio mangrovi]|uniref:Ferrochelatase n=1 Tax=Vibrio mangrovi TaxID=474394 RepID=A0A1Y6IQ50_9VIBR|nr:ferrochelatase [Vibrio mangrovi]MDW6003440.1 ferrochelatase [Vibrio mangrovi]SMR99769.1 Ferrochelatase [Vibrio mangrovi]
MYQAKKQGVLLVNLGTPAEATPSAVKAFLAEFLSDPRVIDLSPLFWRPLLHGIILPIRAPKVARLYQQIWMDGGSPLMVYSMRQRDKLKKRLNIPVELGMTYGQPSLQDGLQRLTEQQVESVIVLPLYPQYSGTTTAAVYDALGLALKSFAVVPELHMIRDYYQHPLYIKALAEQVRSSWEKHGQGDYLLCSYHGIPQRYANNGDIYPLHCVETTRLLATELALDEHRIGMAYQSRFGKEEWLQPYTDKTLESLPQNGIRKLDVISPAFSVDCLETLEEIAQQGKETFLASGGEVYNFVACLNDSDAHISLLAELVKDSANRQE